MLVLEFGSNVSEDTLLRFDGGDWESVSVPVLVHIGGQVSRTRLGRRLRVRRHMSILNS